MQNIYTIGYEGTDIERFLKTLVSVGIDAVADVRALPLSRKKGFSKNVLALGLNEVGINYIPYKELGDPKEGREAAKRGDYKTFEKVYTDHLKLEASQEAMEQLIADAHKQKVCLLCFERDYKTCHRNIIANQMKNDGFNIFNLYADDPERYIRNPLYLNSNSLLAAE